MLELLQLHTQPILYYILYIGVYNYLNNIFYNKNMSVVESSILETHKTPCLFFASAQKKILFMYYLLFMYISGVSVLHISMYTIFQKKNNFSHLFFFCVLSF